VVVFADADSDNTPDLAEILRVGETAPPKTTTGATGMAYHLVFNERGISTGGANVYWTITVTGLAETRDVCLSAIGETRIRKSSSDPAC
jgi:hypothetical protein